MLFFLALTDINTQFYMSVFVYIYLICLSIVTHRK